jgi:Ferritin-like domain
VRHPAVNSIISGGSRRQFLLGGVAGGAALAGLLGWVGRPAAAQAPSSDQDERILNYLLRLEYLQAAFYAGVESQGVLGGETAEFARVVAEQEHRHVERLQELVGDAEQPEPELDLEEAFLETAVVLEVTGVSAYIGQGSNLTVGSVAAVAPLVSVEGRHAAWILAIAGRHPAPAPADPAASAPRVESALQRVGLTLPGS